MNYYQTTTILTTDPEGKQLETEVQYKGYWTEDRTQIVSLGEIKFENGDTYQGILEGRVFNGKGRFTHKSGDVFQGEYTDGKANGFGVSINPDGSMYDGEWLNDIQHGHGIETWVADEGNMRYEGNFVEGKKTGQGRFDFQGSYYEGDFVDGQFHGNGRYYFAYDETPKLYTGEFKNNNMNGRGTMIYEGNGPISRYEGEFKDGKMEGHGTQFYREGHKYIGEFKEDVKEGSGIWYDIKSQLKRQGNWKNDKRISWAAKGLPYNI